MTVSSFWKMMEDARDSDTNVFYTNLESETNKLSDDDFLKFRGYLTAYMDEVLECVWLDMACKVINGYVSDDTSLYFVLWVVSQGKSILLNAIENPDSLAELKEIPFGEADFEMLMGVGFERLESMGDEFDSLMVFGPEEMEYDTTKKADCILAECKKHVADSIRFKDNKKYGDYDEFDDAMDDILNVLPKLIQRAKQESFNWETMYEF